MFVDMSGDEHQGGGSRILGPLQNGMVVGEKGLGQLVRQTAINAAQLHRSYERTLYDQGKTASVTKQPALLREKYIHSIVKRHLDPTLPGQLYSSLFTNSTSSSKVSSSSKAEHEF